MSSDGEGGRGGGESHEENSKKTLYIGNLKFESNEDTLKEVFGKYGRIVEARVPRNERGRSKGFGFVQFETEEEAQKAVEGMDNQELDGRTLRVNISQPRTGGRGGDSYGGRRGGYGDREGGYGGGGYRDRDRGYDDRDRDRDRGYGDRDRRGGYDRDRRDRDDRRRY
jgi:RNA recognition motif-containing protein